MFVVTNLLSCGIKLMSDQAERYKVAALLLEAGIKAAALAAFPDSSRYLKAGIEFLKGGDYWNDQYDLSLKLFSVAADTDVCTQQFENVIVLADEVVQHARTVHDALTAHVANFDAYGQSGNIQKAIDIGLEVLRQLKEPLPPRATKLAVVCEVVKAKILISRRLDYDVLRLCTMDNKDKIAAMHILTVLLLYAYQAGNMYTPLMGTRLVRLCLKYGFHKWYALGFATLGWVLCRSNRDEGYKLGTLALTIIEKTRAREIFARVHLHFYGLVHHWKRPLRDSLKPLQQAAEVGLATGDVVYAMMALYLKCTHSLNCGVNLKEVERLMIDTIEQVKLYKQVNILQVIKLSLQVVHNLTGRASNPMLLIVGEIVGLDYVPLENHPPTIQLAYSGFCASVAFRFGDHDLANHHAENRRRLDYAPFALFSYAFIIETEGLIAIAQARRGVNIRKNFRLGRSMWKTMKAWAGDCSENFLYRQLLMEAELKSLKPGKSVNDHIKGLYDKETELALQESCPNEAAEIAYELAGDFLERQNDEAAAIECTGREHIA